MSGIRFSEYLNFDNELVFYCNVSIYVPTAAINNIIDNETYRVSRPFIGSILEYFLYIDCPK